MRRDGRAYLYAAEGVVHLSRDEVFSFPVVTLCGRTVPLTWRASTFKPTKRVVCISCRRTAGDKTN